MTLVAMEDVPPKTSATVHEADEIYPDARNDFGEGMDGFGMTGKEDDGFGEFVDLPSVAELTREGGETRNEMEVTKVAENGGVCNIAKPTGEYTKGKQMNALLYVHIVIHCRRGAHGGR